ncbi:MAG: molybdate ABC transporter substrate-binding protein [unclassified Hahellaceae]|nr:molybdate ABC transporter substrate-binding protein [Hahellaceae bacterium]
MAQVHVLKPLNYLGASAALAVLLTLSTTIAAETVSIAVAANFAAPMARIIEAFEAGSEHQVQLSLGSSGKLYAQISHGAPFEVFFSADQLVPSKLAQAGLALTATQFTYAVGQLVLWSAAEDFVDDKGQVLRLASFDKLAIANPRLAPYGAAAVEVLEALDRFEEVKARLIMGENIAQTYHFVSTGNADLGFVAASQVMRDGKLTAGSGWLVPQSLYTPIYQDAILLKTGADNPAARAFIDFVKTPEARRIMAAYAYVQQVDLTRSVD